MGKAQRVRELWHVTRSWALQLKLIDWWLPPLYPGGIGFWLNSTRAATTPSPPRPPSGRSAPPLALSGRSSPPHSNPPRLPHGSQTPRPTCSRGPVRPKWTEGDQALSHPPPLGGATPAAALSVRAATGGAGARGCRRMIREVAPGGTSTSILSTPPVGSPLWAVPLTCTSYVR